MKKLVAFALVVAALAPAVVAQTASFTGKWEGTLVFLRPNGSDGDSDPVVLNLMQKGQGLTGTLGSGKEQWKIDKGAVNSGKATFEAQEPNGPLFKFTLTIVKGRLQGEITVERDGVVRGKGKVDAAKAK